MEDRGEGYVSVKLGPAVPIDEVINKMREARPEVVGVSMRLGDLHVDKLIGEFVELATLYGCTRARAASATPSAACARRPTWCGP
jgi:hypothetical protein